jgi:hypothetical protein
MTSSVCFPRSVSKTPMLSDTKSRSGRLVPRHNGEATAALPKQGARTPLGGVRRYVTPCGGRTYVVLRTNALRR